MAKDRGSYPLRMGKELRAFYETKAQENDRSLNTELVRTLRKAKQAEEQQAPTKPGQA